MFFNHKPGPAFHDEQFPRWPRKRGRKFETPRIQTAALGLQSVQSEPGGDLQCSGDDRVFHLLCHFGDLLP